MFKLEWSGDGFIGLNAKTYYCFDKEQPVKDKYSSKGVNRTFKLTKEDYLEVLKNKTSNHQTNRGFIFRNKSMFTYEMDKKGLSYLYVKRKVLDDGVSTSYLNL